MIVVDALLDIVVSLHLIGAITIAVAGIILLLLMKLSKFDS